MAAVKDLEEDIHRLSREIVNQARANLSGALTQEELIRAAANANMVTRLSSLKSNDDAKTIEIVIKSVVHNRILQKIGIWADAEDADDAATE